MDIISEKKIWNQKVFSLNGSFLQSWEWGALQEGLGRKVLRIASSGFAAQLLEYDLPFRKHYLYSPRGPLFNKSSGEKPISHLYDLQKFVRNEGAIFLKIEPEIEIRMLEQIGFKKTATVQPETSLILDLGKTEEILLREMEHDTRYSIRAAVKRGVSVKVFKTVGQKMECFEKFWAMFQETNKRHDLKTYPRQYYELVFGLDGECYSNVLIAEMGDKILGGAIILFFGGGATYLYAASFPGYGKFNAPTLILWEAIREAKHEGVSIFDLWGISHEKSKWQGITAFKKSFGGKEINYSGTWDLSLKKGWHTLYDLAKRVLKYS